MEPALLRLNIAQSRGRCFFLFPLLLLFLDVMPVLTQLRTSLTNVVIGHQGSFPPSGCAAGLIETGQTGAEVGNLRQSPNGGGWKEGSEFACFVSCRPREMRPIESARCLLGGGWVSIDHLTSWLMFLDRTPSS